MQIFVKIFTKKTITFDVDHSDTIEDVKQKVQDIEGIPLHCQVLFFSTKLLNCEHTIGDCNIQHGDTLRLILRL